MRGISGENAGLAQSIVYFKVQYASTAAESYDSEQCHDNIGVNSPVDRDRKLDVPKMV